MNRRKKGISSAFSLLICTLMLTALARAPGGSFSVSAGPQDPTGAAVIRAVGGPALTLAGEFRGVRLCVLNCPLAAQGYKAEVCAEMSAQKNAARAVREALRLLPEGMTDALADHAGPFAVLLCGQLRSQSALLPDLPRACLADCGGMLLLLIDCGSGGAYHSAVHELCHLTDRALAAAAADDPSHWSEAGWLALCPEGFSYYGSYMDGEGRPYSESASPAFTAEEGPESAYFVSRYSKTFPTEDRATLMEALVRLGGDSALMRSGHLTRKAEYYRAAIDYYLCGGRK